MKLRQTRRRTPVRPNCSPPRRTAVGTRSLSGRTGRRFLRPGIGNGQLVFLDRLKKKERKGGKCCKILSSIFSLFFFSNPAINLLLKHHSRRLHNFSKARNLFFSHKDRNIQYFLTNLDLVVSFGIKVQYNYTV